MNSKIRIYIADNGNFNITTKWSVMGLYCHWSCCESWVLGYDDKEIQDNDSDWRKEKFVDEFNSQKLEVEKECWDNLFDGIDEVLDRKVKLTNGKTLNITSNDSGYYSCEIIGGGVW